jgi:hypothetical protein
MHGLSERRVMGYTFARSGCGRVMTRQIGPTTFLPPLKIRFHVGAGTRVPTFKIMKAAAAGIMDVVWFLIGVGVTMLLLLPPAYGQESARDQMKGLDEQVQEMKTDVLSIAAQLNQLEEKLLYPSDTQVAIFVSVAQGEKFRLDAVDLELDGKPVAHHLYTFKELEALQKGGVQRIYVGNARTGEHALKVSIMGKSEGGSDFKEDESFTVTKGIGPKAVGVMLAGTGIGGKAITLKDW